MRGDATVEPLSAAFSAGAKRGASDATSKPSAVRLGGSM